MQNPLSSTMSAPSNANTPKNPPSHPLFRSMLFNDTGNSMGRTPQSMLTSPTPVTPVSNTASVRNTKNFMFNTPMRPVEGSASRSMRTMNITELVIPSNERPRSAVGAQPYNYNLRLERRPFPDKKTQAEAYAKVQARAEAVKVRAKVKAEADVKARAAARTTARAAAKAAALERARRAKEESANARASIPTWERSNFDADPSDTPYGV